MVHSGRAMPSRLSPISIEHIDNLWITPSVNIEFKLDEGGKKNSTNLLSAMNPWNISATDICRLAEAQQAEMDEATLAYIKSRTKL